MLTMLNQHEEISTHKQEPIFHSLCIGDNVVDFSLQKLLRISKTVVDSQQQKTLAAIINDYKAGVTAIAWKRGNILWKKIDTI